MPYGDGRPRDDSHEVKRGGGGRKAGQSANEQTKEWTYECSRQGVVVDVVVARGVVVQVLRHCGKHLSARDRRLYYWHTAIFVHSLLSSPFFGFSGRPCASSSVGVFVVFWHCSTHVSVST